LTCFLARAQFSLGSAKGATESDKSARLALGLRLTLLDRGDAYLDEKTARCHADAFRDALDKSGPPPPPFAPEEVKEAYKKQIVELAAQQEKRCREEQQAEYRRTRWNNSGLIVDFARSWISTAGNTSDLRWNGAGLWSSLAYGFEGVSGLEDSSQLIVHYRYRSKE